MDFVLKMSLNLLVIDSRVFRGMILYKILLCTMFTADRHIWF